MIQQMGPRGHEKIWNETALVRLRRRTTGTNFRPCVVGQMSHHHAIVSPVARLLAFAIWVDCRGRRTGVDGGREE